MPQLLKIGPYIIYFWSNESMPLEPIHVHIANGQPTGNATKIWITSTGKTIMCNNNAKIPEPVLRRIMRVIEANSESIAASWLEHFGEIRYFC